MHFSTTQILATTLALTSSTLALPTANLPRAENVIIGYRTVTKAVYDKYVAAGNTITDEPANGIQLGQGAYLAPIMDSWPAPDSNYMCVVFADKAKILNEKGVSKAWIAPKDDDGNDLWYKENNIDTYIYKLESSWDAAKTLRLGMISGRENEPDKALRRQLLIPPGLLNSNGGALGISVTCVEQSKRHSDLPDVTVDYDDWQNDIKGDERVGS